MAQTQLQLISPVRRWSFDFMKSIIEFLNNLHAIISILLIINLQWVKNIYFAVLEKFVTMLVSSFNLSQSVNYAPYLFCKNGSNQRSIVSIYGPCRAVGKSDEIIALIQSVDFLCDENKGLIVIGTFLFQRSADFLNTLFNEVISFQISTRPH